MAQHFTIERDDATWPKQLRDTSFQKIYGVGNQDILSSPCISIIGSRRGTPYGIKLASMVAEASVRQGITVVSGGALGVDSEASRSALKYGGKTIIVCGSGADVVYPARNEKLFSEVVCSGGALISLEPFGTAPLRWAFAKRNELIAALSRVVVVTESAYKSGTAITVEHALRLNRSIYAFPGSIFSRFSQGNNQLIYDGATVIIDKQTLERELISDYGDVLAFTLHGSSQEASPKDAKGPKNDYSDELMRALNARPMSLHTLSKEMHKEPADLLKHLTFLEIQGLVVHLPDATYALTEKAYTLLEHRDKKLVK